VPATRRRANPRSDPRIVRAALALACAALAAVSLAACGRGEAPRSAGPAPTPAPTHGASAPREAPPDPASQATATPPAATTPADGADGRPTPTSEAPSLAEDVQVFCIEGGQSTAASDPAASRAAAEALLRASATQSRRLLPLEAWESLRREGPALRVLYGKPTKLRVGSGREILVTEVLVPLAPEGPDHVLVHGVDAPYSPFLGREATWLARLREQCR
jgi:type IV secretory pathway VirB10-like protein